MEVGKDDPNDVIEKLSIPTTELTIPILQDVLRTIRSSPKSHSEECLCQLAQSLWEHLTTSLGAIENQFLCSTCLFNTLLLIKDNDEFQIYFNEMIADLDKTIVGIPQETERLLVNQNNMFKILSYIHGIFQVQWPFEVPSDLTHVFLDFFNKSFRLLTLLTNRYSPYTFVAFKLITYYKKTLNTVFEEVLNDNKNLLLNIVCLNWENPIPGVRDLNRSIFAMAINILDDETYNRIASEIDAFVWNKAKYLMLAEIITCDNKAVFHILKVYPRWVTGVVNSLNKPGLVSAGADMYFAIMKGLNTADEWSELFYNEVVSVLNGNTTKAISNFINYWCLNTLKKFPELLDVLHAPVQSKIYASLGLMKQANRLGMVSRDWNDRTNKLNYLLNSGLVNSGPQVRLLAFDIIATAHSNISSMPLEIEFKLVYIFLVNNVNCDCAVLRISMLDSLKLFLARIHSCFKQIIKAEEDKSKTHALFLFCKNIQLLIIDSLNLRGNYQRKITILKICMIVLESLREVPKKRAVKRVHTSSLLIEALKAEGAWLLDDVKFIKTLLLLLNDPAEDVKEHVLTLLLDYYSMGLIEHKMIDKIIDNAFACTKSKFFYEISCGQTMIKLVASLMTKHQIPDCKFNNIEDIFVHICEELVNESKKDSDVLKSIENGQQLHSYISLLNTILKVTYQKKYKMTAVYKHAVFKDLLRTLENVSNQFVDGDGQNSDFSKINELINESIQRSGGNLQSNSDDAKISDLQQIVLHTMWLNVKATCELAGTIIKCQQSAFGVVQGCLNIIANALETCRHKGAIEAAGAALGNSIKCLTSAPPGTKVSKLPELLLKKKLKEMIVTCEQSKSSVTRRGAGHSIMIHRIVANDTRQGKPLFHFFMRTILIGYNRAVRLCSKLNDNETDLPQAIYLHFLTKIVTDSSLGPEVMYYSAKLAEYAFDSLTSQMWQVRNAALQLYGALVPKLMGQKKNAGDGDESIGTVACDEFKVHFPKLWSFICIRLSQTHPNDNLQTHSNLVPILNMLANSALRYNFSHNINKKEDAELFRSFIVLLSSPLYTVRRLTAQCIAIMYPFKLIYDTLIVRRAYTENCFHGYLTLIKICYDRYIVGLKGLFEYEFIMLIAIYKGFFLRSPQHSYLSRNIFDQMHFDKSRILGDLFEAFERSDRDRHILGFNSWAVTAVRRCVFNCDVKMLPNVLDIFMRREDPNMYLFVMHEHIKASKLPTTVLKQMCSVIMRYDVKFTNTMLLKILYEIAATDPTNVEEDDAIQFYCYLRSQNYKVPFSQRYIIPFATAVYSRIKKIDTSYIFHAVANLSTDDKNVNMRLTAALANNHLARIFYTLQDHLRIISLKTTIVLLQDEDEEVRNASSNFMVKLKPESFDMHPFVCLSLLMDFGCLRHLLLDRNSIFPLCDLLEEYADNTRNCVNVADNYNPFTNDSSNIYFEHDVFKRSINELRNAVE